ncbi:hypothetical protein MNBD_GAMMA16-1645 [hydrothermal vent metagenome]|uniref:Uncharacterized protein n=1 Tax=hydrothermal vent metagenome TaxID=652676 RepID=A0A3B0ZGE3_9ZZZZ
MNYRQLKYYLRVSVFLGCLPVSVFASDSYSFNYVDDNPYQQTQKVKAHQLARFLLASYVDRVNPALRISKHGSINSSKNRRLRVAFQFDLAVQGTNYRFKYKEGSLGFSPRSVPNYMGQSVGAFYTFVGVRMKW